MTAPRSKPLLDWEPFPFAVAFVGVLVSAAARPAPPWLFLPLLLVGLACLALLVQRLVVWSRPRTPGRSGELADFAGIELVDAAGAEREVRTSAPVDDVQRHQAAIELARLGGGARQHAVLVPRSTRWMSRRYRIAVQLDGDGTPRHAGFLKPGADERWRETLDRLGREGRYVRVPAVVVGETRPFGVELDLSGLPALEAEPGISSR